MFRELKFFLKAESNEEAQEKLIEFAYKNSKEKGSKLGDLKNEI